MSYFTYVSQNPDTNYMYLADHEKGISIVEFYPMQTFIVRDHGGKNSLHFRMSSVSIADKPLVMEMCRSIARMANGKIRNLVEDSRVLLLMKEYDLTEIYHSQVGRDQMITLWTTEDADALMS